MRIVANKSILHNNVSGCTFIASEMDEKVQTGTRENDSHIEWMGDLNFSVPSQSRIEELEARNKQLREALQEVKYLSGDSQFYNEINRVAEQALKEK